ncbi:hypothetical protein CPC08DRAFT_769666 [Agrocybe pediades]|nr:hypothetical protein CPC08DRAFT_769666 [Agrocybe pediades]
MSEIPPTSPSDEPVPPSKMAIEPPPWALLPVDDYVEDALKLRERIGTAESPQPGSDIEDLLRSTVSTPDPDQIALYEFDRLGTLPSSDHGWTPRTELSMFDLDDQLALLPFLNGMESPEPPSEMSYWSNLDFPDEILEPLGLKLKSGFKCVHVPGPALSRHLPSAAPSSSQGSPLASPTGVAVSVIPGASVCVPPRAPAWSNGSNDAGPSKCAVGPNAVGPALDKGKQRESHVPDRHDLDHLARRNDQELEFLLDLGKHVMRCIDNRRMYEGMGCPPL